MRGRYDKTMSNLYVTGHWRINYFKRQTMCPRPDNLSKLSAIPAGGSGRLSVHQINHPNLTSVVPSSAPAISQMQSISPYGQQGCEILSSRGLASDRSSLGFLSTALPVIGEGELSPA